ncbi:hypothetical protein C8J57DRAFT_1504829 [Mycena rebaudengoi]|nr:hypothetical protein C8J57DRAFT_1504829 [Mycena rebaudengoi]
MTLARSQVLNTPELRPTLNGDFPAETMHVRFNTRESFNALGLLFIRSKAMRVRVETTRQSFNRRDYGLLFKMKWYAGSFSITQDLQKAYVESRLTPALCKSVFNHARILQGADTLPFIFQALFSSSRPYFNANGLHAETFSCFKTVLFSPSRRNSATTNRGKCSLILYSSSTDRRVLQIDTETMPVHVQPRASLSKAEPMPFHIPVLRAEIMQVEISFRCRRDHAHHASGVPASWSFVAPPSRFFFDISRSRHHPPHPLCVGSAQCRSRLLYSIFRVPGTIPRSPFALTARSAAPELINGLASYHRTAAFRRRRIFDSIFGTPAQRPSPSPARRRTVLANPLVHFFESQPSGLARRARSPAPELLRGPFTFLPLYRRVAPQCRLCSSRAGCPRACTALHIFTVIFAPPRARRRAVSLTPLQTLPITFRMRTAALALFLGLLEFHSAISTCPRHPCIVAPLLPSEALAAPRAPHTVPSPPYHLPATHYGFQRTCGAERRPPFSYPIFSHPHGPLLHVSMSRRRTGSSESPCDVLNVSAALCVPLFFIRFFTSPRPPSPCIRPPALLPDVLNAPAARSAALIIFILFASPRPAPQRLRDAHRPSIAPASRATCSTRLRRSVSSPFMRFFASPPPAPLRLGGAASKRLRDAHRPLIASASPPSCATSSTRRRPYFYWIFCIPATGVSAARCLGGAQRDVNNASTTRRVAPSSNAACGLFFKPHPCYPSREPSKSRPKKFSPRSSELRVPQVLRDVFSAPAALRVAPFPTPPTTPSVTRQHAKSSISLPVARGLVQNPDFFFFRCAAHEPCVCLVQIVSQNSIFPKSDFFAILKL